MSGTTGTWDTGDQIRNHKLACSIINLHGTDGSVFDQASLEQLMRFTDDICMQNRDEILMEKGWVDAPGVRPGSTALTKDRSLTGLLIARYGTEEPALDERDWQLLKEWCNSGMPTGQHVQR